MEVERYPLSRGPVGCPGSPYSPGASLFFLAEGWQTRGHLLCPLSHDPTSASWTPLKPQAGVQALGILSLQPMAHPTPALQSGNMPRPLQPLCLCSGCSCPAWPRPGSQGTSSLGVCLWPSTVSPLRMWLGVAGCGCPWVPLAAPLSPCLAVGEALGLLDSRPLLAF